MFKKYAAAAILEARMADGGMLKSAHRAVFSYTPREGYLYVRSRAISSRCNDNFDAFPAEEIEKSYLTFIGKPVFVNHHNEDHRRARGMVLDAALHKDRNPDGSADTWCEVLMEVDAIRFPKLAKAILNGEVDRTSMGCDVQISKCSACGNVATSPLEYCAHIPGKKGKKLYKVDPRTGQKTAQLIFEICSGLSFFENSLLVEAPADPTAYFLGNVEVGPGLDHLTAGITKSAAVKQLYPEISGNEARGNSRPVSSEEFQALAHEGHQMYDALGSQSSPPKGLDDNWAAIKHHAYNESRKSWGGVTVDAHTGQRLEGHEDRYALSARPPGRPQFHVHEDAPEEEFGKTMDAARSHYGDVLSRQDHHLGVFHDDDHKRVDIDPIVVVNHPHEVEAIGAYTHATGGAYHFRSGDGYFPPHVRQQHAAAMHPYAWNPEGRETPFTFQEGAEFQRQNFQGNTLFDAPQLNVWSLLKQANEESVNTVWDLIRTADRIGDDLDDEYFLQAYAKAKKPVGEMSAEEYAAHKESTAKAKAEGEDWNKAHPVGAEHIVNHWHQATADERANGMNWYADAHHLTKHIANDTGTPMHTMAGLMSNYSPQTHWATNIMTAARVARTGKALGGKGGGVMASDNQRNAADRILQGEHYDHVLGGPKTKAFAHLIEHGGNSDDSDPKVVVDRHALSVAAGSRASDNAYMYSKLGTKGRYKEVTNAYHEASKRISEQSGQDIKPHQVQAVTWLVRQRLNEQHDRDLSKTASSRSASRAQGAIKEWNQYAAEHHPSAIGKEPGTGYSKSEPEDVRHAKDMKGEGKSVMKVAYGETKSPQDVDTLRSENCNVCGNSSAWDGTQCQVCGYVAPPRPFGDPDTSVARDNDIRKQVLDGTEADPNNPNQQLGQQLGNPDELQDQQGATEAGENTQLQTLTCDVCGTGIQPTVPKSESTGSDPANPEADEEGSGEPAYPAEGDVCPVCQKGQLLGSQDDEPEDVATGGEQGPQGAEVNDQSQSDQDGDEGENEESGGTEDSDDNDQDDDDAFDPKKKGPSKKASSSIPSWFRPVWFQG